MKPVQIEVLKKLSASKYCPPSKPGAAHWVTEAAARHLIEHGVARYLSGGIVGNAPEEAGPLKRSPGWPIDRFSFVERKWLGDTVVCFGGGPSLTVEDIELVRQSGARTIAINDTYLLAPWADLVYFADFDWWEWHTAGIAKPKLGLSKEEVAERFAKFAGQKVSIFGTGMRITDPKVHMLRVAEHRGLSRNPQRLVTGGNSGYQAINLAVLAGAAQILLLGYNMSYPGGSTHWHGGHPKRHDEASYFSYAKKFERMRGELGAVKVINCTINSKLEAFPRGELASLLPHPREAVVQA